MIEKKENERETETEEEERERQMKKTEKFCALNRFINKITNYIFVKQIASQILNS